MATDEPRMALWRRAALTDPNLPGYVAPRRLTRAELDVFWFRMSVVALVSDLEKFTRNAGKRATRDGRPYREVAEVALAQLRIIASDLKESETP